MNPFRSIWLSVLAIALLSSCSRNLITRENYNQVKTGMSAKQVETFLGAPTTSESTTVPLLNIEGTRYEYRLNKTRIQLSFVNDKLVVKEASFE